jgi:hypothetical protein
MVTWRAEEPELAVRLAEASHRQHAPQTNRPLLPTMPSDPSSLRQGHKSDKADHTYSDSGSETETSILDTTPFKLHQRLEPFSDAAKRRVDAVTTNMGNRRLVTNCPPHLTVDYAHLLPRTRRTLL